MAEVMIVVAWRLACGSRCDGIGCGADSIVQYSIGYMSRKCRPLLEEHLLYIYTAREIPEHDLVTSFGCKSRRPSSGSNILSRLALGPTIELTKEENGNARVERSKLKVAGRC